METKIGQLELTRKVNMLMTILLLCKWISHSVRKLPQNVSSLKPILIFKLLNSSNYYEMRLFGLIFEQCGSSLFSLLFHTLIFVFFCRFLMISWQWKKGKNHRWCWTWINVMLTVPWAILPVMLLPVYFNNLQFYSLYWRLYWCYFENKNPF